VGAAGLTVRMGLPPDGSVDSEPAAREAGALGRSGVGSTGART
jgi:hypothetical protein